MNLQILEEANESLEFFWDLILNYCDRFLNADRTQIIDGFKASLGKLEYAVKIAEEDFKNSKELPISQPVLDVNKLGPRALASTFIRRCADADWKLLERASQIAANIVSLSTLEDAKALEEFVPHPMPEQPAKVYRFGIDALVEEPVQIEAGKDSRPIFAAYAENNKHNEKVQLLAATNEFIEMLMNYRSQSY